MLISEEYRAQQEILHENPEYGVASIKFADHVTMIIDRFGITELLDYGCGKGRLAKKITPDHSLTITLYDPAIKDLSESPEPHQMVACIDVLEHIEPECLDNVLDDLQRVTKNIGFFTIHTGEAMKTLPDGRNAHLIQEGEEWWLPKIMKRFELLNFNRDNHGFYVVVRKKHGDHII